MLQMMHLREENEALMDSLVRTKVELADTQGQRGLLSQCNMRWEVESWLASGA